MDKNDLTIQGFLEVMRQLVYYTDLPQDRKDYFMDLLTSEKFDQVSPDDAGELMLVLPEAQQKMEKILIESRDPEKIYALAELKSYTTDLMDGAEEKALQEVLNITDGAGDNGTADVGLKDRGEWLLNKLAGLPTESGNDAAETSQDEPQAESTVETTSPDDKDAPMPPM